MTFRQQVIIALIHSAKDWVPTLPNAEAGAAYLGIEVPKNNAELIDLGQTTFAVLLDGQAQKIIDQFRDRIDPNSH